MILVHFWNMQDAVEAMKLLKSQYQTMDFFGEENLSKMEELEEPIELTEIIETEIPQEDKKPEEAKPMIKETETKQ